MNFFKLKPFLFLWLTAIALNIITFLLIFFKTSLEGPHVALRYNIRAGVLWYGDGKNLFFIPLLGLALNTLNFYLYKKTPASENFLRGLTPLTAALVQAILLISIALIAQVN